MNKALIAACCVLVLASAPASAEVYKWKDKSGKTQYSDSPPLSNIPYTTLSGKKSPGDQPAAASAAPAAASKSAADTKTKAEGSAKPAAAAPDASAKDAPDAAKQKVAEDLKEKAAKEAEAKKQQEEKLAADKRAKEQACKNARSRVAQFEQGGRIYRVDEQGERQYYGDKEIAAELENAKNDMEANCE